MENEGTEEITLVERPVNGLTRAKRLWIANELRKWSEKQRAYGTLPAWTPAEIVEEIARDIEDNRCL